MSNPRGGAARVGYAGMNYLSVCSGIEAATVAWHSLGWTPVAFSEIEPFPSAVLAHHYPGVPNLGDMTKYKEWNLDGTVDLLVGGTPCQSFSVAGLRRGLDDPRGNLMLVYLGILDTYRPRWMVWENVPGVLSSISDDAPDAVPPKNPVDMGREHEVMVEDEYECTETHAFACFLSGLSQLGYGFAYRVLDAQYLGVPQRRRRVFVVGYLGDWRPAAAVLFERHSLSGYPPPRREAGQRVAATLTNGFGERGVDADQIANGNYATAPALTASGRGVERTGESRGQDPVIPVSFTVSKNSNGFAWVNQVSPSIDATGGAMPNQQYGVIAHALRAEHDASEDGTGRGTPLMPVAFQGGAQQDQIMTDDAVCPTLAHSSNHHGGHHQPKLMSGMAIRRLTPRECERLQGFPDDYTLIPLPLKGRQTRQRWSADGQRYRALGNSMAVPVMRWIGERIQVVEEARP